MNGETSNIKILLVEDDKALAITISNLLRVKGYEVTHAGDGAAGIQKAFALLPDLILCDISMPNLDGYQMLEYMNNNGIEIPLIFMSDLSGASYETKGLQMGAAEYIQKPIDKNLLLLLVEKVLKLNGQAEK